MHNYLLYYGFLVPISRLPLSILYLISGLFYWVISPILGYRKKVIQTNLKKSFPQASTADIEQYTKKFYRHFADLIVESVKNFTLSEKQLRKRIRFTNPEVIDAHLKEGSNVAIYAAHYNNWELYMKACGVYHKYEVSILYQPLKNLFFEKKLAKSRSQYGTGLFSVKNFRKMLVDRKANRAVVFGGDQSPGDEKNAYWTNFLNQESGFLLGGEKYARARNVPVYYASVKKITRGHYEVTYHLIHETPKELEFGVITEKYIEWIEKDLKDAPEYWLWSHKRWKKKKPENHKYGSSYTFSGENASN